MDSLFQWCVLLLVWLASLLGITYETINVLIFCVAWPIASLIALVYIFVLRRRIQQREAEIAGLNKVIDNK